MKDKTYFIASVSWGKDSTAMLIKLIENNAPLDEVVFYDTGMEFDAIYKTRDLFLNVYLKPRGIKYTELKPKRPFLETMLSYQHKTRNGNIKLGYGWCGGLCRWGTTAKIQALDKYCKDAHQYIGIAYDEPNRFQKLSCNKSAPLYELHIKEEEALRICYARGFNFGGLYGILKRVSCWCCRNKNLKELENYKNFLPDYYEKLKELEIKIGEPMKKPYYLKERFEK